MKRAPQLLIGSAVKVIDAKNKSLKGIEGKVIDETKNLLIIETRKGIKKLIKDQIKWKIKKKK